MKKWLQKNYKTIIISAFLIPIIIVAFVSISHVTGWYGITNPFSWAVYLSIGVEIAALASLAALAAKMGKYAYFPFILVTIIQFVGNVFFSYSFIDVASQSFKSWVELVTPVVTLIYGNSVDVLLHKRILAIFSGGLLPVISLSFMYMLVKFTEQNIDNNTEQTETVNIDTKHNTESIPEITETDITDISEPKNDDIPVEQPTIEEIDSENIVLTEKNISKPTVFVENKNDEPVLEDINIFDSQESFDESIVEKEPIVEVIEDTPIIQEPTVITVEEPIIEESTVITVDEPIIEDIPNIEEPIVNVSEQLIEEPTVVEEIPIFDEPIADVVDVEPIIVVTEQLIEEVVESEQDVVVENATAIDETDIKEVETTGQIIEPQIVEKTPIVEAPLIVEEIPIVEQQVITEDIVEKEIINDIVDDNVINDIVEGKINNDIITPTAEQQTDDEKKKFFRTPAKKRLGDGFDGIKWGTNN